MTYYEYRLGQQGPWNQVTADQVAFAASGHVVFSDNRDRLILAIDRPAYVRQAVELQDTPSSPTEELVVAEEESIDVDFYEKRLDKGVSMNWEIFYKRDVPRLITEIRLLRQRVHFLKGDI